MHLPAEQWSPTVQAFESSQVLVSSIVPMQLPSFGSQVSSVQALPSSQPLVEPGTHTPAESHAPSAQASVTEHGVLRSMFCVTHSVAFTKLQVLNVHSWS